MMEAIGKESAGLYMQSSKLRALARMFQGCGDIERPAVTFGAVELDGCALLLLSVADAIDATRDRMEDITAA